MSLAHSLKLFLPSWNFFDDFSVTPRLLYRVRADGESLPGEWRLLHASFHTSSLLRAFYNPSGNAELFELTLVDTAADACKLMAMASDNLVNSDWADCTPRLLAYVRNQVWSSAGSSLSKEAAVQYQLWFASNGTVINSRFESIWHPLVDASE